MPNRKYTMVGGSAELGGRDYQRAIKGLYGLACTIKFLPNSGIDVPNYHSFTAEQLQGLYQESEPTRNWTLLIAVPDFVTDETVRFARAEMRRKKKELDDVVWLPAWGWCR